MAHLIIGATVTNVRPMTVDEADAEGWEINPRWGAPTVIVLSNGTKIYASRDSEGNGPGELFGRDAEGGGFFLQDGGEP